MGNTIDFPSHILAENVLSRMTNDLNALLRQPLSGISAARLEDEAGRTFTGFDIIRELAQTLFALSGELDREMQRAAFDRPPGGSAA